METGTPLNYTPCQIRHVVWSVPTIPCDRCQQPAARVWDATRTAIDIGLDHPILLLVTVSVHHCRSCAHYLRVQPPFLHPDATYTRRVMNKAMQAVYDDGMAVTRVSRRLARDFWVRPSEGMIRQWCRQYRQGLDFVGDYQPWVVEEFSGVLCVDEVYQDTLALLLAVDPAAPEGDRLVGYQLVHGAVDQAVMQTFLERLRQAGVTPDEVISDGSPLYPRTLATVWPQAAHQLCLFHQTRLVTKAVLQAVKEVRATLPPLPRHYRVQTESAARPPAPVPSGVPARGRGRCRQEVRQAGIATVHAFRAKGYAIKAIARQTGLARATIRAWLQEAVPPAGSADAAAGSADAAAEEETALQRAQAATTCPPPPPAPWESWEQVQRVREGLGAQRFRLLRRPDHLTDEEQNVLADLFASPVGAPLRHARAFLEDWYDLWRDEEEQRRQPDDAWERYAHWHEAAAYGQSPALRKMQERIDARTFEQLSYYLAQPTWEGTNNGAERMGRAFRHGQAPHFSLRTADAIEADLVARALGHKEVTCRGNEPVVGRSRRGRKGRAPEGLAAAA